MQYRGSNPGPCASWASTLPTGVYFPLLPSLLVSEGLGIMSRLEDRLLGSRSGRTSSGLSLLSHHPGPDLVRQVFSVSQSWGRKPGSCTCPNSSTSYFIPLVYDLFTDFLKPSSTVEPGGGGVCGTGDPPSSVS